MKDDLPTIDPTQLAAVTGGATDPNAQLTQMLQTILSSIQDLAKSQQGGGNDQFMQMLPILMMMRGRGGAAPPPPPVYPDTVVGPDGLTYTKQS